MVDPADGQENDESVAETVVVDRSAPEDHTVVVDRSAPEDHTVVVDRSAPEDHTVVVDRSAPEDHTVVVDRSASEDHTVVVHRSAPDDGTAVIDRGAKATPRLSVLGTLPRRGRRKELTPAPGGPAAQRKGVAASGPGAVSSYAPRAIPAPPVPAPQLPLGPDATRMEASLMPSVSRQSRRVGVTSLALALGACIVSVVGIVLIVIALVNG